MSIVNLIVASIYLSMLKFIIYTLKSVTLLVGWRSQDCETGGIQLCYGYNTAKVILAIINSKPKNKITDEKNYKKF